MGKVYLFKSVLLAQLSLMIGMTSISWSSPMMPKLNSTNDNPLGRFITSSENSWLTSLPLLGSCVGPLIYGTLAGTFGRKTLLLSLGFPFFIFYLVLAWAEDIRLFYISRFATGVGLGGVFTILPMYVGEMADADNRGTLGTSMAVFLNLGVLIPYSIGPYISYFKFQILLAAIAAAYVFLFFTFASESPHYLISKDPKLAETILIKLRRRSVAEKQYKELQEYVEDNSRSSFKDAVSSKGLWKGLFIGFCGLTFATLTGNTVVVANTQSIFKASGGDLPPEMGPIIVGISQLLTTIVISIIVDRFSRKSLLVCSFIGCSIIEIPLGLYFYLRDQGHNVEIINWLPLVCLILFTCFYNAGIAPIILTLLSELFPLKVKGLAAMCMSVYYSGSAFLLNLFFNSLKEILGIGGVFWLFSGVTIIGTLFVKFFVIETKGKTLQEIQKRLNR